MLKHFDESGFCLCLPPTYTWTRKGPTYQHRVRTRWGSKGRVNNLIGTLSVEGEVERMEYEILYGGCRAREVLGYLDTLWPIKPQRRASLAWWLSWRTRPSTGPRFSKKSERNRNRRDFGGAICRPTARI